MSNVPIHRWLTTPLSPDVAIAIERLRRAPDIQHIAIMPDVHLSADVCIGVAIATSHLIYPQAVGGDIGCGMLAVQFDAEAAALDDPRTAAHILNDLARAVPARRRRRNSIFPRPCEIINAPVSNATLDLEFATLGSGNHFIELQSDDEGRLWLMVHSGSRALGPAIRDHYLDRAQIIDGRLRALDASSGPGIEYLHDAACARRFAEASRTAIAHEVCAVLSAPLLWDTAIHTDHNHVVLQHQRWVHRKGAMSAKLGEPGVVPGSMGTLSFHVEGRGHEPALCSSAHGAGRILSRGAAYAKLNPRELERQMKGVWFDSRNSAKLLDEAPSAYKDIRAVLRAQRDLVKITHTLRPLLNYKAV